jgi:hypothetical protein
MRPREKKSALVLVHGIAVQSPRNSVTAKPENPLLRRGLEKAGVTQPPWLYQFRLGWTSVWDELVFIPIIEPPTVRKVESKKRFLLTLQQFFFFSPRTTLPTQQPHLLTYNAHFAMAKPIPFLN